MDIEKNQDNKNEFIKSSEINQEILELKNKEKKANIKKGYSQNKELIKGLAQKAFELSNQKETELDIIQKKVKVLDKQDQELSTETENKIEQEIKESNIDHLPNYQVESEEAKLTEIISASENIQERFEEKISPDMKEAIALVCGRVFNKGTKPYELIGSNSYIAHTEYSEKISEDLDIIFSLKDLDMNLAELKTMQEEGLIKDLSTEELRKFGQEKNGCIKVSCLIKTTNGWKEMEAFAQNMHDEVVNQGKDTNGLINLGVDKHRVEVVVVNGVKVNIANEKTVEELYLKNIVNEFALYDLNGWEKKGSVSAKALQRIFNVINLDSQRFEDSINQIIENIKNIDPPTPEAEIAQKSLRNLWTQFKALPAEGTGLVKYLMTENNINIETNDNRERKVLSTEAAVDIITIETKKDMQDMSDRYQDLEKKCQEALLNSPEKSQEAIEAIDAEIKLLSITGLKYKNYLNQVNSADKNDFCVYAAMPQLRNHFILPIITRLMKNRKDLKDKIKQ